MGLLESAVAYFRSLGLPQEISVPWALLLNLPWWLLWAVLTPLVVWLARTRPPRGRGLLLHACAALGFASAHLLIEGAIYHASVPIPGRLPPLPQLWRNFFGAYLMLDVVTYCVIVIACEAFDAQAHKARLEVGLAEARLQALRAELNPHFFFNALNAISGLVRLQRNDDAVRMLAGLGELLQTTLGQGRAPEIPLREELQLLERYLAIERVRFGDRLTIDVSCSTSGALVPTLILQPLVENAIRHGIARRSGPGHIRIVAERDGDALLLAVRDTGEGVEERPQEGVGLSNTRARLRELYGAAASLVLENLPEGGARVRLRLPFREAAHA